METNTNRENSAIELERAAQALDSLNNSIKVLEKEAFDEETLQAIIAAKFLTPKQDNAIAKWFAHFLSLRQNLWALIDNAIEVTGGVSKLNSENKNTLNPYKWAYFIIGYSAVCSLVRLDRFLLNTVAYDPIIQRKLNEGFKQYRIERKQWTAIFNALTRPDNALKIFKAHLAYRRNRSTIKRAINTLEQSNDHSDLIQTIFTAIPEQESYIDLRWYKYLWARLEYRYHSWRRRNASLKQQSAFAVLEYGGRVVSEINLPTEKRVSKDILEQLRPLLEPGDIFISRHNGALTNLFLPGFWPHAALYIGDSDNKKHIQLAVDNPLIEQWSNNICTFEALKDGVHFRKLEATLNVDCFVVLRPNLNPKDKYQAISRALVHAGKDYNFDFDLFRSDQLVCTEVIYRAYDGIGGKPMPLTERLGKKTLSAEDILDYAIDKNWATPIAIYNTATSNSSNEKHKLITGDDVLPQLISSYR